MIYAHATDFAGVNLWIYVGGKGLSFYSGEICKEIAALNHFFRCIPGGSLGFKLSSGPSVAPRFSTTSFLFKITKRRECGACIGVYPACGFLIVVVSYGSVPASSDKTRESRMRQVFEYDTHLLERKISTSHVGTAIPFSHDTIVELVTIGVVWDIEQSLTWWYHSTRDPTYAKLQWCDG